MKKTHGLTRADRLERITSVRGPDVADCSEASLLCGALEIAGSLRYHNLNGVPDGYFRELLPELEKLLDHGGLPPEPDGRMEPAQALLYTFLHNLHEILENFNRRWDALPRWYLDEVGGIPGLDHERGSLWVSPEKGTKEAVAIGPDTVFVLPPSKTPLRPEEEVVLENPTVHRVVSVHYDRQGDLFPASAFDFVTSVEVREFPDGSNEDGLLFAGRRHLHRSGSPGFIVSSPALLLREGRRAINVRLETESNAFTAFVETARSREGSPFAEWTDDEMAHRLLTDIFHIEISVSTGWEALSGVTVAAAKDGRPDMLTLRCALPEEFASAAGCTVELHGVDSPFPALRASLNVDARLYPYSWIKEFVLKRIAIDVDVCGLSSLVLYNDLGRVDNSKPFPPFGLGADRGAWFVVGSYEMAMKHIDSFDLRIEWSQLPQTSLYEHYRTYAEEIDNRSFTLEACCLHDYRWHDIPRQTPLFLFASDPSAPDGTPLAEAPLAAQSLLCDIFVERMSAYTGSEDDYDYTIRSKTGFVRFDLAGPSMGFGEKRYRELFSEQLMQSIKKKAAPWKLEPPVAPSIERITADYRASDLIDLRECEARPDTAFWHIHPLGIRQVYPNRDRRSISLIPSLQGEAHLLFGLSGVQGGEYLRLWFDFAETEREMGPCPAVRWFWGDGYDWRELPQDMILCDTTDNFSGAGMIGFDIPDLVDKKLRDGDGTLWFRATVVSGIGRVPVIRRIVPNAIRLRADGELHDDVDGPVELQKPVPGIAGVQRLSLFAGGRRRETPTEKMARVSEFVTHRGRAVVARDYERLVMQEFPDVDYVRCFPDLDTKGTRRGVVTVVAIPSAGREGPKGWRPRMTGRHILRIEKYLAKCASHAVTEIDVINPLYEEVLVRGVGEYRAGYSTGHCRTCLKELCDRLIAPWQQRREIPVPGLPLRYDDIAAAIRAQPYVACLDKLTIIRLGRSGGARHVIEEFDAPGSIIGPSEPYAVFVPAREHLFPYGDESSFGIGEMAVDYHFII